MTAMETENSANKSSNVPKSHDILWFPGGDVVLSADQTLFKVHKDVLSLQSSVFKDMFGIPTLASDSSQHEIRAGNNPDVYEGLPLVELIGDKEEDVAHLLRTVYERQYYDRSDVKTPIEVVLALLVLSTKYDFKHIRREVIEQISGRYPIGTLYDYEVVDLGVKNRYMFGNRRADCHIYLLEALHIANVDPLLPVVYYACSSYTTSGILQNADTMATSCLHTLLGGKEQVHLAKEQLIARLPDILRQMEFACPSKLDCSNTNHFTGLDKFLGSSDLGDCEGEFLVESCVVGGCSDCREFLSDHFNATREEIWDKIPSYFGFPEWGVLRGKLNELCAK